MRYKRAVVELVDADVDPGDLVTMSQAAEILGVTLPTLNAAVNRGTFETVIFDMESVSPQRGRKLLLREEVLERAARRGF
jgi:hypothetical protein